MKLGVIDPLSPRGHVSFNQFYFESLGDAVDCLFISNEIAEHYHVACKRKSFNVNLLRKGRLVHALYSLYLTLKTILYFRVRKVRRVVVLSYDIFIVPALSLFARIIGVQLVVFEHNTIPFGNNLKTKLQRRADPKVIHRICLRDDVAEAYREMGQSADFIPLPILSNGASDWHQDDEISAARTRFDALVFCPSASSSQEAIEALAQEQPNILFVIKTGRGPELPNCISRKYFDCYNWIMDVCDFVYLPASSEWKVSGPFYEALYFGKSVIVDKTSFGRFARRCFPENVLWSTDALENHPKTIDVEHYNEEVRRKFIDVCQGVFDGSERHSPWIPFE